MKIAALFIQLYLVKGPNEHCHLEDLAWAWKVFVVETGVQEPESWLRDLVLEHNIILEEPPKGQSWRGWRVEGVALNPEMVARHSRYRLERMGIGT
jgi:hypothetical protein